MFPRPHLVALQALLALFAVPSALAQVPLRTPERTSWLDPRIEPLVLVRSVFAYTLEDQPTVTDPSGKSFTLDSTKAPRSAFGHRRGFVLEDAEVGLRGRFNELGLYYQVAIESVPREKDGNRSDDYLEDAFFGWDAFTFLDLRAGRMKVPFGQANLQATAERDLPYAPTLDVLVPKRQLGLRVSGGDPWGASRLHVGVYNSVSGAQEELRFLEQLLYVTRLELRIHKIMQAAGTKWLDFECTLGGSFAWTEESFDPPTEHRWVGADLHLHLWRFTLRGELVIKDFFRAENADGSKIADRGLGWSAELTTELVEGLLDTTVRVEETDGDDRALGFGASLSIDEAALQNKRWVTVGLGVTPWRFARISANWIYREELEGYSLDNDVFLLLTQLAL